MIRSFMCKDTDALFAGQRCHRRWLSFRAMAERKLAMLHRAMWLDDLRIPPQIRLEARRGDRTGQWSKRIDDQWRVCFVWDDGQVFDVEMVDDR